MIFPRLVFFSLPYVFLHKVVFLNIIFITYQKKKCGEDKALKDLFLELFLLAVYKNTFAAYRGRLEEGSICHWNPTLCISSRIET